MLILGRFGANALWGTMFLLGLGAALIMARLEQPKHVAETAAVPAPTTAHSAEP
jgi:hypothetical protein